MSLTCLLLYSFFNIDTCISRGDNIFNIFVLGKVLAEIRKGI